MKVDIPAAGRVFTQARDTSVALMLRAVRSQLTGLPDDQVERLAAALGPSEAAWTPGLSCAHRNRLSTFAFAGLQKNAVTAPAGVVESFLYYKTDTFRLNTRNLMTVRRIVPLIEMAGFEVVVIKGPLQQRVIHDDFFAKPAGDVDLLVNERDFLKVRSLIETQGYYLPKECASPWWRIFLGEQHLLTDEPTLSTIDLHHRVQQPGAPSPTDLNSFLRNRRTLEVGAVSLPILGAIDALLLKCMSLAKALIHREPAGGYAMDLLAGMLALDAAGRDAFAASASHHGLRRTVQLALRALDVLFGVQFDINRPGEPRVLDHTTDEDFLGMLVTPGDPAVQWAKRRNILWALNDAGPITYSREVGWAVGGEVTRRLFQATPGKEARAAPSAS